MDLEHKLTVAKEELEKTALDKVNNSERYVAVVGSTYCKIIFSSTVLYFSRTLLGHNF